MILSNKGITKALIRMQGCAGWAAPLLLATPEDRFSRDNAQMMEEGNGSALNLVRWEALCCILEQDTLSSA